MDSRFWAVRVALSLSLLAACCPSAVLAQSGYDLRMLSVASGFAPNTPPGDGDEKYIDPFNNGNPLVGPPYMNGAVGIGSYTAFGTPSAGAELSGPAGDILGITYGIGRMRFQLPDAAPNPSNLDLPGTLNMSERLRLDSLPFPLLRSDTSFEVTSYWNFVLPDARSTYGLRLSDNPFLTAQPGTSFDDVLDLRVVRSNADTPLIQLRRLVFDGVSTLSIAENYFFDPAATLPVGWTLADVAYIGLEAHYNAAGDVPASMLWSFYLFGADGEDISKGTFAPRPSLFHGETTTDLVVGGGWTVPVPEPATWLLMLAGGAALALRLRRRRAAHS